MLFMLPPRWIFHVNLKVRFTAQGKRRRSVSFSSGQPVFMFTCRAWRGRCRREPCPASSGASQWRSWRRRWRWRGWRSVPQWSGTWQEKWRGGSGGLFTVSRVIGSIPTEILITVFIIVLLEFLLLNSPTRSIFNSSSSWSHLFLCTFQCQSGNAGNSSKVQIFHARLRCKSCFVDRNRNRFVE